MPERARDARSADSVSRDARAERARRRWLFALDTVDRFQRRDVFIAFQDRQLTVLEPITSTVSYDAVSYLRTRSERVSSRMRLGVSRPRCRPTAIRARARWRSRFARAPAATRNSASAALDWFRDNGLEYTLEPGVTSIDSVDTRLFDSKRGFCGHFASVVRDADARRGSSGAHRHRLSRWRVESRRRLPDRAAVRRARVDGGLARRHRAGRASIPRPWSRRSACNAQHLRPAARIVVGAPARFMAQPWFSASIAAVWDGANQWWQERVVEFNLTSSSNCCAISGIDSPDWQHLGWAFAAGLAAWIAWVSLALRRRRRAPEARPHRPRVAAGDAQARAGRAARAPARGRWIRRRHRHAAARPGGARQCTRAAVRAAALRSCGQRQIANGTRRQPLLSARSGRLSA